MPRPLITLALFSYNQEEFIRPAVEAALAQTYSPLEIILSDDGSTDTTFEIIRDLASCYSGPHTIILNQNTKNLGLCAHVNRIFEMAKGDWIVAAAGDDISLLDRCEKLLLAALKEPDAKAVTSAWIKIDEKGTPLPYNLPKRYTKGRIDHYGQSDWAKRYLKSNDIGTCGATAMWSRDLFTQFGPIPVDVPAEDAVLSFRAYLTGSVIYVKDPLVKYRSHSNNLCAVLSGDVKENEKRSQKFSEKSVRIVEAIEKDYETYCKFDKDQLNASSGFRLITWSRNFQQIRSQWWDRNLTWRIYQTLKSIYSGNIPETRWRAARLNVAILKYIKFLKSKMEKLF